MQGSPTKSSISKDGVMELGGLLIPFLVAECGDSSPDPRARTQCVAVDITWECFPGLAWLVPERKYNLLFHLYKMSLLPTLLQSRK